MMIFKSWLWTYLLSLSFFFGLKESTILLGLPVKFHHASKSWKSYHPANKQERFYGRISYFTLFILLYHPLKQEWCNYCFKKLHLMGGVKAKLNPLNTMQNQTRKSIQKTIYLCPHYKESCAYPMNEFKHLFEVQNTWIASQVQVYLVDGFMQLFEVQATLVGMTMGRGRYGYASPILIPLPFYLPSPIPA